MDLRYWVVDAFTDTLFTGNPAAVVLPDTPLPEALMRQIAAENNLSETAFAVPEADGYRLRWFTPTVEVDLCGHATLATAFILGHLGHAGPFRFHTRSGVLTATVCGAHVELDFPAHDFKPANVPEVARVLGVEPLALFQSADLVAVLPSAKHVAALRPDPAEIRKLPGGALIVTAAGGEGGADITSRYFAPAYGIEEDPVTGSLHTQVVPYWVQELGRVTLTCRQASARGGGMVCTAFEDRVLLSGTAVLYASGVLHLAAVVA